MAKYSTPGVYRLEEDLSEVTVPASTSIGALVGHAKSGPANRRVRVGNDRDFYETFGAPVSGDTTQELALYQAGKFLQESNALWFVRSTDGTETYPNVSVQTNVTLSANQGVFDAGRLSGYDANDVVSYLGEYYITSASQALTESTGSVDVSAVPADGDTFVVDGVTYEFDVDNDGVTTPGNVQVLSAADADGYADNLVTAILSQYTAENTVVSASATTGTISLVGKTGVDATVSGTGSWYTSPMTSLTGGAQIQSPIVNTTDWDSYPLTSNRSITELSTTALLATAGYADGNRENDIQAIEAESMGTDSLIISSLEPGLYGEDIGVTIFTSASLDVPGVSAQCDWKYKYDDVADVDNADAIWKQVYKVNVYKKSKGATFGDISSETPEEVFYVSNNSVLKDSNGNTLDAETLINGVSQYIYVKSSATLPAHTFSGSVVALDGGTESTRSSANIISGWSLFSNKDKVQVNILMTPDPEAAVAQQANIVAGTRMDCMTTAQVGTTSNRTAQSIVDSFVSVTYPSYTGLYCGFTLEYDKFSDKKIYLPNAIYAPGIMARTDRIAETWDAPAGPARGVIGTAIDQLDVWEISDTDYLYDNNINPVRFIRGQGFILWGQKTAQRKASALDRINVRRLLIFLQNTIEPTLEGFIFEPNDEKVRSRIYSIVNGFMETVESGGGVYGFNVVCNESNNTPQIIDQNQLNLDLYVQPTKTAEFIQFKTIVTRTGVSITAS